MRCETVKVKPWDESQGDFVEINKEDFNEETYELYVEGDESKKEPKKPSKTK